MISITSLHFGILSRSKPNHPPSRRASYRQTNRPPRPLTELEGYVSGRSAREGEEGDVKRI